MITLFSDGNKSPRGASCSYRIEVDGRAVKEETVSFPITTEIENDKPISRPTVPELEYKGLLLGLLAVRGWIENQFPGSARNTCIEARVDAQLVVKQVNGKHKCVVARLRELRSEVRTAAAAFEEVKYIWVPRDQNRVG